MERRKIRYHPEPCPPHGGVWLNESQASRLREALEQMDLLLSARQAGPGVQHLASLLIHLRAFREELDA